jgi:hypothetical protein
VLFHAAWTVRRSLLAGKPWPFAGEEGDSRQQKATRSNLYNRLPFASKF